MKVSLTTGTGTLGLYAFNCLRYLCQLAGVQIVSDDEADAFWVSICDPDELPDLLRVKKKAAGRPVIMGGYEAYFGVPYLAWADYINVGEGWDFIRTWGEQGPDAALALPCVLTKNSKEVIPSYHAPFELFPIVKVSGKNRFYYLSSRGCKNKCAFCGTSWSQPYQSASEHVVRAVVSEVERKKGRLTLSTNDSGTVVQSKCVNAQSVKVRDYLVNPKRYKSRMLHFGIEAWNETQRARWGKPIKNSDITDLIHTTRENRQQCEFFFIVGYDGWSMADVQKFVHECVPVDTSLAPRIETKCTYLDPCPHTRISKIAINPQYCDIQEIGNIFHSTSRRFRLFPTRSAACEAWRVVLHRSTPGQAVILGNDPKIPNSPGAFDKYINILKDKGLDHLIGNVNSIPSEEIIKVRIRL